MKNLNYTIQEMNYINSVKKAVEKIRREKMEEEKLQQDEEEDKKKESPSYGITEAPKDHPDNKDGNMKIIME